MSNSRMGNGCDRHALDGETECLRVERSVGTLLHQAWPLPQRVSPFQGDCCLPLVPRRLELPAPLPSVRHRSRPPAAPGPMYGLLGHAAVQRIMDRRRRRGRGRGSGGSDGGGSSGGGSDHSRSPRGHAEPPRIDLSEYMIDLSELMYRRGLLAGGVAAASAASASAAASGSEAQLAIASMERGLSRVASGDDTEWDRGVAQVAAARACFHAASRSWDEVLAKVQE